MRARKSDMFSFCLVHKTLVIFVVQYDECGTNCGTLKAVSWNILAVPVLPHYCGCPLNLNVQAVLCY